MVLGRNLLGFIAATLSLTLHVQGQQEFDYVVVGSGAGGGVVATELAKAGFSTLLIEAGPDHSSGVTTTPVLHIRASEDPAISFEYFVKHYPESTGLRQNVFYPRVGALGGCPNHHAMIALYPNTRDFDLMVKTTNDNSWKEGNMRKYFKRMERNYYRSEVFNPDHGFDGWFPTSYINFLRQLTLDPQFLDVLTAIIGNPFRDVNGKTLLGKLESDREGTIFVPQNVDGNTYRRGDYSGYIKNVASQGKLTIWTDTLATKIILDEQNVAKGVEFQKGQYLYKASPLSSNGNRKNATSGQVLARKEVIISAGTFNTPQLLMLSGIGDKEHLTEMNIETKIHLPGVGRNMQDRYETPFIVKWDRKFSLLKNCKFWANSSDPCYEEYRKYHTGPYISNGVVSAFMDKSQSGLTEPDLFTLNFPVQFQGYFKGYSQVAADHPDALSQIILKAHTKNKAGVVRLSSADPFDTPYINFHYFEQGGEDDLNAIVSQIRQQRKRTSGSIWSKFTEYLPGKNVTTDEQLKQYIREISWGHHACCTAKVGEDGDAMAVLDSKFRVRGAKNLRVVDASVFPEIPGYFPVLYIHMLAQKVAEEIIASA
ncbi:alcohol oxidase [Basidiobolus meristosporus CBS 931.73]|uniref:Alcohol oxidase n=1 Tax=Basidiobolus meristosporus CBS 931.73 TaxID=1314790 RepID=A0A1Y1XZP4_9FUNG|nr:alcohol oxidase [Basidiobolus meristosporus CBS 931.73]|eukprot:ORX91135.1 alcohol oxidase [Basidiobolus meristosporus CBS 931.73]